MGGKWALGQLAEGSWRRTRTLDGCFRVCGESRADEQLGWVAETEASRQKRWTRAEGQVGARWTKPKRAESGNDMRYERRSAGAVEFRFRCLGRWE